MQTTSDYAIVALTTLPTDDEINYLHLLKSSFIAIGQGRFNNYVDVQLPADSPNMFSPSLYYLFGKFDIAMISIIDNVSVTSKAFLPINSKLSSQIGNSKLGALKAQVISGICLNMEVQNQFLANYELTVSKPCISISNFKLNNGFLLGSGFNYKEFVYNLIAGLIPKDVNFQIVDSFGVYEMTLILFGDRIDYLSRIVETIRELTYKESFGGYNASRSVYSRINNNGQDKDLTNSHLFTDSQSFFGTKLEIENGEVSIDWSLIDKIRKHLQFQIKPGHKDKLIQELRNMGAEITENNPSFTAGKYDYEYSCSDGSINFNLYKRLRISRNESSSLKQHVVALETKLLFSHSGDNVNSQGASNGLGTQDEETPKAMTSEYLRENFVFDLERLQYLNSQLKAIKISRTLRYRILKLIINYNNGIQNPIEYNLFVDFRPFLDNLIDQVNTYYTALVDYYSTSSDVEMDMDLIDESPEVLLSDYILVFEHAFSIRYVNNLNLEDSYDFNTNYNSQIQQLISALDSNMKVLYALLEDSYILPALTLINGSQTVATRITVNFSLYNFYEPSILCALMLKELVTIWLNSKAQFERITSLSSSLKNDWMNLLSTKEYQELHLVAINTNQFDFSYILHDYIRLVVYFHGDVKLFYHFHWKVLLQIPQARNLNGQLDKSILFNELFRIMMLVYAVDTKVDNTSLYKMCPDVSLMQHWSYYRDMIINPIRDFAPTIKVFFSNVLPKQFQYNGQTAPANRIRRYKDCMLGRDPLKLINCFDVELANGMPPGTALSECTRDFIYGVMHETAERNNYMNVVLNRSWETGVKNYSQEVDMDYLLDPLGGVWFHRYSRLKEYCILRNNIYLLFQHISNIFKAESIITKAD